MNERMLLEPLRERLYYACDAFVTYIDSRVLIFDSNELPQNLEDKAEFITTRKYYILESGDLCLCNDLYFKEDIRLFNRIRFEQNEEIRNFAFRCLYNGLMEELENEDEKSNIELLTKKSVDYLLEIGLYNIDKYKNEISEAYKKIMNEENQ